MPVLAVSSIVRRADARPLDERTVKALADSIAEIGLINPVRVRAAGEGFELIAGSHRLAAHETLGLAEIEAVVATDDDLRAELAMIDENLLRSELSPAERARQTYRRKEIYEELHPETRHGANQHTRGVQVAHSSFADETAAATGRDASTIRRDASRGEKVIPEVIDMIRGTKLDTGTYLDQIKRLPPNDQVHAARRDLKFLEKQAKPARLAPDPLNDFEAREKQVNRLMSAWNAASPEAREDFLSRIDKPVFDGGRHHAHNGAAA